MAEHKNLTILKSSTKAFELIFTRDNIPYDITGWTIYFTVKSEMEDEDVNAVINKKIVDLTNPEGGKTLIELASEDTNIEPENYWYSLDYKDDEGNEDVLFYGNLTIRKSVRDDRD